MIERQIIFKEISAKFTKDFDTFGKMDPFLTFSAGQLTQQTQVADNGGKQPKWTSTVNLNITYQKQIVVTAYDQDATEDQLMGVSKINISTLKNTGQLKIVFTDSQNKSIGQAFCKYEIKQTKIQLFKGKYPNVIIISQITAKFAGNSDTFGKMQPFFNFKIAEQQQRTEVTQYNQNGNKWDKIVILGYKTESKDLTVQAFDQDATEMELIGSHKIDLKSLKSSGGKYQGNLTIPNSQNKNGGFSFNYQIKSNQKPKAEQPIAKKEAPKQEAKKQQPQNKSAQNIQPQKPKSQVQIPKPQEQKKVQEKKVQQKKVQQKKVEQKKVEQKKIQQKVPQQKKPIQQPKIIEKVGKKLTEISERKMTQKSDPNDKNANTIDKVDDKVQRNVPNHTVNDNSNSNRPTQAQNQSIVGRTSLNKSRDSIRLPSIGGDISKNYGDKIFDKQSSATLQKSILVFSMPKAPRFGNGPKYAGEPSYYVDTCFKPNGTKGVGFGFGAKRQFPEWLQKNMKQNPAPCAYFDDKRSQFRAKGPTFGISHKYYEKVTIPRQTSPQRKNMVKSNQRLKPIIRTG